MGLIADLRRRYTIAVKGIRTNFRGGRAIAVECITANLRCRNPVLIERVFPDLGRGNLRSYRCSDEAGENDHSDHRDVIPVIPVTTQRRLPSQA